MRAARLFLAPAAVAFGIFAEWAALQRGPLEAPASATDFGLAAADLVTGWVLVGGGLGAWARRPQSRVGPLLCAAGFAWFLGTFASSGWPGFAAFGSYFLTLHRGPLAHALLAYPSGRVQRQRDRAAVAIAYTLSVFSNVGTTPAAALALAAVLVAGTALRAHEALGAERRARVTAAAGATLLAAVLVVSAAARVNGSTLTIDRGVLWAYDIAVAVVAGALALDLVLGRAIRATVTGLVVDLGEGAGARPVRDQLAAALGDRSLQLGYSLGEGRGYVDEVGRELLLPDAPNRRITRLHSGSEEVAALVHDADLVADDELVEAVAGAARIAVANARLQAEVRAQVAEIEASRRRLLEAGDAERQRLERELQAGAERRLAEIERLVELARSTSTADLAPQLADLRAEVANARAELREFARGVHPRLLAEDGLAGALRDLAGRTPLEVELSTPDERFAPPVEAAAYFICSEALTNAAKHASATHVDVDVSRRGDALVVRVVDDGRGGANLDHGSGLRGLDDRVSSLGGRLTVTSPRGRGTRLVAELPLV